MCINFFYITFAVLITIIKVNMSFFKDLIFEKDGKPTVKSEKTGETSFKSKFPNGSEDKTSFSFPTLDSVGDKSTPIATPSGAVSCEPYISSIMEMYEKGFDSLNQAGYDFYEYFKAVVEGGADNKAVYPMAFKMGNAMGGNIDKKTLLDQASYYISKLNDVHTQYKNEGDTKKNQISNEKSSLEVSLKNEVLGLDAEISRLTTLMQSKQTELSKIDNLFTPKLSEIDCKLEANDLAKSRLVNSINLVVNGIKTNL